MLLGLLHRRVVLPALEGGIKRRNTYRYWRHLERTQWLSRDELEKLQFDALRRLVAHAYDRCPYYRAAWSKRGLEPGDLREPEDFARWPVLERDDIRDHRADLRARVPGLRLLSKSTGGSTGEPLHFDLDVNSNDWRTAAWHRGYSWAGAAPGTRQVYLWGVPLAPRPRLKRWKDALYHRFHRRLVLNTFDLDDGRIADYLGRLNRYRPDAVVAYTGALYAFARALAERGRKPFTPKGIVVGAEKLHPFQRRLIEEVFGAPVFETYGSREVMLIGAECERRAGLHLTAENLVVEVLGDEGRPAPPGAEGDVVITDLNNYGMPFIRYRNGDRATAGWGACPCGRGLPLLREVAGRRADVLRTPDGRRVTGLFFPHLMKDYPAVRRFLVVQERPDRVEVRLVLGPGWRDEDRASMERAVRAALGPAVDVALRPVEDIPLSPSGKQQVVLSLCN